MTLPEEVRTRSRILVVDDIPENVELLARFLERDGYSAITTLTDAREVMPALAVTAFDLVLLDLHMPHVDGLSLVESVIPALAPRAAPVVIVTADVTRDVQARLVALGVADIVLKPYEMRDVLARVRVLLAKAHEARGGGCPNRR